MTDFHASMGQRPDGSPMLKTRLLAFVARLLNIQFRIGGQPYGARTAGFSTTLARGGVMGGRYIDEGGA